MENPNLEMNDATITERINKKIATGEFDSSDVVALTVLRAVPLLKDIVNNLRSINGAINREMIDGLPTHAPSLVDVLWGINATLENCRKTLERFLSPWIKRR